MAEYPWEIAATLWRYSGTPEGFTPTRATDCVEHGSLIGVVRHVASGSDEEIWRFVIMTPADPYFRVGPLIAAARREGILTQH